MPCDYHSCAQCLTPRKGFEDKQFTVTVERAPGRPEFLVSVIAHGYQEDSPCVGALNLDDMNANEAREAARRLLDAADKAEELTWQEFKR